MSGQNDFATYKEAFEFAHKFRAEVDYERKKAEEGGKTSYDAFHSIETFIGHPLEALDKLAILEDIARGLGEACEWNLAHLFWHLKHEPTATDVIN